MVESYALSDVADNGLLPEERGSLTISTAALKHLVEAASRTVTGTVPHTSTLRKVSGTSFPRADASIKGDRAWVSLDVAAAWPCPASHIVSEVRDRVRAEAARLSGLAIESLDVRLHLVKTEHSTRRRVQ